MTGRSAFIDPAVQTYVAKTVHEHPVAQALREETSHMPDARMQIGPDQAQFMQLLAHTIGAQRYLEIGVFTGYSALALALALPPNGRIVACDVNEAYTNVARRYWKQAGVSAKIDLRLAPALETLDRLIAEPAQPFDLAFIDADKENVVNYYEKALALLRPGGLILVDNVLWDGAVADPSIDDTATRALRAVSARAASDPRTETSLVTVGDGLLIARKR
ncbi:MAG: class I SAM-dependent methyltransferase [Candidatus Eremiobacteraeota bacterium]|nr:class I SAM-dependent methyltransferase [Candidatus Eremiobacteraeota bacterium]MBV8375045.1 class I SAM-dependent methyltransferase [Candidatus Eremiobacteraeota bacterium]